MYYRIEDIPDEQTMQAAVAHLLPLVPSQRREKALCYKHLHGQYCCLRAWQLLHELLTEHAFLPAAFPLSRLTYTEDEYGKPSISEAVFFSISHTKNAIAVAISHAPVGIDVEAVVSYSRINDSHFLARTMNAAEQQLITGSSDPRLAFTGLWTRKEALVKAIGTGLNLDTLPSLLSSPAASGYQFISGHTDSYAYAIVSQQA